MPMEADGRAMLTHRKYPAKFGIKNMI